MTSTTDQSPRCASPGFRRSRLNAPASRPTAPICCPGCAPPHRSTRVPPPPRATSCGGAPRPLRSRRLPTRQRCLPRLHVGLPRRLSRTRRAARRAAAPRARARAAAAGAVRRLSAGILVRPSRGAPRLRRVRRCRARRADLLHLVDAARRGADGADGRGSQPAGRRRFARGVSRRSDRDRSQLGTSALCRRVRRRTAAAFVRRSRCRPTPCCSRRSAPSPPKNGLPRSCAPSTRSPASAATSISCSPATPPAIRRSRASWRPRRTARAST